MIVSAGVIVEGARVRGLAGAERKSVRTAPVQRAARHSNPISLQRTGAEARPKSTERTLNAPYAINVA